jgi:purine nucleosidase
VFDPDEAARVRGLGTPLARFCMDIQRVVNQFALNVTRLEGFDLPDPMAMAVALDPTVATLVKRLYVEIEASSISCRGQTIVDHLQITGQEPNVNVVLEASREKFLSILHQSLKE